MMMELKHAQVQEPLIEVMRHRATVCRTEPSLPMKCVIRDNLLDVQSGFFDDACGYGDDLQHERRLGFIGSGWDPAHRPQAERTKVGVVNLGYVINVGLSSPPQSMPRARLYRCIYCSVVFG